MDLQKSRENAERCGRKLRAASKGASEEQINVWETEVQPHLNWGEYLEYAWEQPYGWAWPNCCISLTEESFHLLTFSHPSLSCVGQACSSSDRDNREKKGCRGFSMGEFWGNPWGMETTFCAQSPSWRKCVIFMRMKVTRSWRCAELGEKSKDGQRWKVLVDNPALWPSLRAREGKKKTPKVL